MTKTYEDGVREGREIGRIDSLEIRTNRHEDRLDHHSRRMRIMEKMIYIGIGFALFLQVYPDIARVIGG